MPRDGSTKTKSSFSKGGDEGKIGYPEGKPKTTIQGLRSKLQRGGGETKTPQFPNEKNLVAGPWSLFPEGSRKKKMRKKGGKGRTSREDRLKEVMSSLGQRMETGTFTGGDRGKTFTEGKNGPNSQVRGKKGRKKKLVEKRD